MRQGATTARISGGQGEKSVAAGRHGALEAREKKPAGAGFICKTTSL
jgi:hypothetical protein